ncbi:MAG: HEAT repeat domain-containing protein [Flavobacteriales bacterium]|nr:HEAT repeat domain-containing protein [Flavobacteriales bacterium]
MRLFQLLFVATLVLCGCSDASTVEPPPNRWSDAHLWPVLEAQEHRDTQALCALLQDTKATVRTAAALAFASVQESAALPCLLKALRDDRVDVRATVAFALGFIADSSAVEEMAKWAIQEKDSTVQHALFSASFLAMQRNDMLTDVNAIFYLLERSRGQDRMRAADALRRSPDSTLQRIAADYLALFEAADPGGTEGMLMLALGKISSPEAVAVFAKGGDRSTLGRAATRRPRPFHTARQFDRPAAQHCHGRPIAIRACSGHSSPLDPARCDHTYRSDGPHDRPDRASDDPASSLSFCTEGPRGGAHAPIPANDPTGSFRMA